MALLNKPIESDISVYNIVKILSNKFSNEEGYSKCDKALNKKLLSVGFNVLIYNSCINCDYSVEELEFAILFRVSDYYHNAKIDGRRNYNKLKVLMTSLEKFRSSNDDATKILKFLYLLHIYNNSDQHSYNKISRSRSSVGFDELTSNSDIDGKVPVEIQNSFYNVNKESLILNFDIDPNIVMVQDLEMNHSDCRTSTYVSREDLRQDIKYALIGIPSTSFLMKDSSITLKDGLFTDGINCSTLLKFLEPIAISGNCFRELIQLIEDRKPLCFLAVLSSFKHFLDLYSKLVDDFPKILSLTYWKRYIAPLHQMIETLKYLANLVSDSKDFFEKVYYLTIKKYLPNSTSFIMNTFLIAFSDQYFQILDEWLFAGTCGNSQLFVRKDENIQVIDCKQSWLKAYIFIKENAPTFLPCLDIFECGKKVALLKLCSESDPFLLDLLSKDSKRPKIRLCQTMNDLQNLKEMCFEYVLFINCSRGISNKTEVKVETDEVFGKLLENYDFNDIEQQCTKINEITSNEISSSTVNDLEDELNQHYQHFREEFERTTKDVKLEKSKFKSNDAGNSCDDKDDGFETSSTIESSESTIVKSEFDDCSETNQDLIDFEMESLLDLPLKSLDTLRSDNIIMKENLKKYLPSKLKNEEFISGFETDTFLIKEIIIKSVLIPLKMQEKLVNSALINVFLYEKNFLCIAENLTNVFFLIDSNFSIPFVDNLSLAVENESTSSLLNYSRIKRLFESITLSSYKNLYFKINNVPECFDLNDPDVFSCISLTYDVNWPLNLLITPKMIDKYNTVFQFLMSIERISWKLKFLFRDLKNIGGNHFREIQLHRFIMTQYLNMFKSYIHNDVITKNWNKFQSCISSIQDLNDLYKNHVEFIKKVRFMCFLGKATIKIRDELRRLFRVILIYCRIASIGQWTINDKNEFNHSKLPKLRHYFDSFMQLARYITAYLEKIVEHRYKSEFDGLLQLLSLNSYYGQK